MKTEVVLTMFGAVTRERRMGRKPFAGGGGGGLGQASRAWCWWVGGLQLHGSYISKASADSGAFAPLSLGEPWLAIFMSVLLEHSSCPSAKSSPSSQPPKMVSVVLRPGKKTAMLSIRRTPRDLGDSISLQLPHNHQQCLQEPVTSPLW